MKINGSEVFSGNAREVFKNKLSSLVLFDGLQSYLSLCAVYHSKIFRIYSSLPLANFFFFFKLREPCAIIYSDLPHKSEKQTTIYAKCIEYFSVMCLYYYFSVIVVSTFKWSIFQFNNRQKRQSKKQGEQNDILFVQTES